ncbi:MAG: primary-amine oxidase [Oligoflexia bacterium]|nr:primary-amine oxidase [Oligoflexia bacterium]
MSKIFGHLIACVLLVSPVVFAASPFDDLSSKEIELAIQIVRDSKKFGAEIRFPVIRRQEPSKLDWVSGKAHDFRRAYLAIFDFKKSLMTELVVDLKTKKILSTKVLPGLTPPVLIEEYSRAREIVKADSRWQKAMKDRGIENLDDVWVDLWAPGLLSPEEKKPGQRILRGLSYKKGKGKNFYSRPIEGIVVNVDLSKGRVSSIWDVERVPIAAGINELTGKSGSNKLKPLIVTQPKGPSFKIDHHEGSGYRWKFRWSMDPLQGLQLYHVRFDDGGVERSILYKISLSEMLVPYGAAQKSWSYRNAFDVGEYGLGKTLHPLEKGKDVPDNATLIDVPVADDLGQSPQIMPGVAFYERDAGILWKHRDSESGESFSDQARQLVVTFMTTIGNYDYGINYIFHMDGVLQVEAQLTGILLARGTALVDNNCDKACKPLAEKNILAPYHQHIFNFRMDFDVDGLRNSPLETNVKSVPRGNLNPDGNVFVAENSILATEKVAQRDLNLKTARKWKVINSNSRNEFKHPRSYALMPGENMFPYLHPSSQIRKRAGFIDHHAWFTVYKDTEMSGAAPYPTTAPEGEGLPRYISNNESLENQDIVMWYTFGITHLPRPEEWPIMNMHRAGFTLMPVNFFSINPAW